MTNEEYKKIANIQGEIYTLEKLLEAMKGCSPSLGMDMKIKTGYSDMGHDIMRNIDLDGDIASEVFSDMRQIINNRLEKARKKFESIKIDGLLV